MSLSKNIIESLRLIKALSHEPIPSWLNNYRVGDPINFSDVFKDSIYYPACGLDPDVMSLCMGYGHSFIYVDNLCLWESVGKEDVYEFINNFYVFGAFKKIFQAEFSKSDLIGGHSFDNEELQYGDGDPTNGLTPKDFFSILTIFQPKQGNRTWTHGDRSIKLHVYEPLVFLYVCADGCFSYKDFYYSHNVAPRGVAIIQPGDAFGGNWTSYYDRDKIFGRNVMNHPAGIPDILISGGRDSRGGYFRGCIWPEYSERLYYSRLNQKGLAVWTRKEG